MGEGGSETLDVMDKLYALKAEIDQAKGHQFYLLIEEVISVAFREGVATKATFEEIGFSSYVADVLEAIPQNRATLGDLAGAWNE